jgi:hypothetical protein
MKSMFGAMLAALAALGPGGTAKTSPTAASPLQGTWTLVAADKILPGGGRVHDYGAAPKGLLIVDAQGRYSLQIFKAERPRFASDDKSAASADEFKAAVLGSSTHYGEVELDAAKGTIVFRIEGASFPNWEGTVQVRSCTLQDGTLSYEVAPRADGSVPVSVWRRLD